MRIAFLGTPEAAVPALRALVEAGHGVEIVVTRADKRRGRGSALVPSPVKSAAVDLGLAVSHDVDDVLGVGAELGVVVAFGRLIRPHVLSALPMVNVHFSLLPRWRGAAPVERAILAGDDRTGVCLMAVDEALDTGAVYARRQVPIGLEQTADELRSELARVGTDLLVTALREGLGDPEPQVGEATYAAKIEPEDRHLDWSRPAVELHRVVRVGGAWTTFRGRRLKVLRAKLEVGPQPQLRPGQIDGEGPGLVVGTGEGVLLPIDVQPEGRSAQPADAWCRGARLTPDDEFV